MNLEQSFTVGAPIDRVWEALIDVQRVAPCLPGAEITEQDDDGTYKGNFTVKLGPTTAAYRGELSIESADEASRTVTMKASGQDRRGQGSAKATIVSVMREEGETTVVDTQTEFMITGRLARFGRGGMIKDISSHLLRDFSTCLTQRIEAEGAATGQAPAAKGGASADEEATATAGSSTGEVATATSAGDSAAATFAAAAQPAPGSPPTAPAASSPPPPTPARPINGLSLFLSVLRRRIGRLFGRG